jgi:hypothetical protein
MFRQFPRSLGQRSVCSWVRKTRQLCNVESASDRQSCLNCSPIAIHRPGHAPFNGLTTYALVADMLRLARHGCLSERVVRKYPPKYPVYHSIRADNKIRIEHLWAGCKVDKTHLANPTWITLRSSNIVCLWFLITLQECM